MLTGKVIGHYRIGEHLGTGGLGEAYRAEDLQLGRTVALKFVLPAAFQDQVSRCQLREEARAAADLNCPQIATIYELVEVTEAPYIVMEFVEGETLARKIEKGPLEIVAAVGVAIQVAQGLKAAHAKRRIHRDLKTANIMITSAGDAKILDFGLALKIPIPVDNGEEPGGQKDRMSTARPSGTAGYMSPEQVRGETLDSRTDLFSLGVVLYESLTGIRPFTGSTLPDALQATLVAEPRPLSTFRDDVPLELESIVRKALAKGRSDRYQSAENFLLELQTLKNRLELAMHHGALGRSDVVPEQLEPADTSRSAQSRGQWLDWLARHKKWAPALSVLTLVAAIWDWFYFSSPGGARVRDLGLLVIAAALFWGYLLLLKKRIQPVVALPKGAAFRGLIAFQEADRDRFFGRELDTVALFDRIRHEEFRFGVLYGNSGCGKTSLLKAGLMPKLWESAYIPLYCRPHAHPLTALLEVCSRKSLIPQKNGEPPQEYLRRVAGELGGTLLVICDQFEEFFVSFKSRLDREPFISFLVDCHNNSALPVKFLISLRSDFLHLIGSEFSGRIAEPLMNARLYHLSNFDARQAEEIIERSAQAANLRFEPGFSAGVARDLAIMDTVLPSELQIVGEQLQTGRIFTIEEYRRSGGKERLVHAYLEDVVQSSGDALAARLVLRSLISDENTRLTLTLEEIARRAQQHRGAAGAILNHFVRARIIGQVQDLEPWRYELMHEYLIDKINHITGTVMDATHRANRMVRQYLSNYSIDRHTRIPLGKLWAIRRYSDMVVEKAGQDLYRKSLRAGLLRWGSLALLCVLASTFAVGALSIREEWNEAILGDGHTAPARQVAFSPDGKLLLSGGEDGLVILWDFEKRLRLATWNENIGQITTVAFSNDGKWFAAGSSTGNVVIWESSHLERRALFGGHSDKISSMIFSPDSRLLVSAGADARTVVWNVGSWEELREFHYTGNYGNLLFLSNTSIMDNFGTLRDATTGHAISTVCKENWNYLALSPDHRHYLGVDSLGRVSFGETGVCLQPAEKIVHKDNGRAAAWSPDGRWAATGAENIVFWDASTGMQLVRLETAEVWSLAFSPDGRWLVSSHGDGSIAVWDAAKRERIADLKQHSAPVSAVAFSPDGRLLASAGADENIIIWNVISRLKEGVLNGHANAVTALAFSPDGKSLGSCDQSGVVTLWDLNRGNRRWTFQRGLASDYTHCLAFSPDGQWIATPGGIYGSTDHSMAADMAYSIVNSSYGLSFSPDGRLLAATSPNFGKLTLLDTKTWRVSSQQDDPALTKDARVVDFSPDGHFLVTGSNIGDVRLWQVNPLRHVALIGRHKTRVKAVAFSPDGRRVISASDDKTLALWDVGARRLVTQIGSHSASVASAAFSKDGRIASGEWDDSVRLYNSHSSLWGRRLNWDFLRWFEPR